MPLEEIEKLEAKIKLVLKEVRRLQKENKKYLLAVQEALDQKKAVEAELEECQNQMAEMTQLEASNKEMGDEKTLLQSKVTAILNDLDKLEFL